MALRINVPRHNIALPLCWVSLCWMSLCWVSCYKLLAITILMGVRYHRRYNNFLTLALFLVWALLYLWSENSVWLDLRILYFRLQVIHKSYRQVLTPVKNSHLLLKLEILDKFRLVTFHKIWHKETATLKLVHTSSGEMGVLMTLNNRASTQRCSPLKCAIFSLTRHKLWHFAATLCNNIIVTFRTIIGRS